jgi:hypothetical protein
MDKEFVDLVNAHPAFGMSRDCYIMRDFWDDGFRRSMIDYLYEHGFYGPGRRVTDRDMLLSDPAAQAMIAIWYPDRYRDIFERPVGEDGAVALLREIQPKWEDWLRREHPEKLEEWRGEVPRAWSTAAQLLDDEMDTL